jgi:hypothetical protein
MTHPSPNLTDAEVLAICEPLKLGKAQCRYLARLGMKVEQKPNGKPLIARGEFERVMIGRHTETKTSGSKPNLDAYLKFIAERKNGMQR